MTLSAGWRRPFGSAISPKSAPSARRPGKQGLRQPAFGQRVEKQAGSAYTEIMYHPFGTPIGHFNRTYYTEQFVPPGGSVFANYQDGKTYFMHPNHLGSTVSVTDQTGATIQKTMYYPFGQVWQSGGTAKDSRFASMDPTDAATGNNPTLFRMQNPRLYRWLSPDPIAGDILNPQSLNRYAYVLNNPTNFIDPLGLDEWCASNSPNYPGCVYGEGTYGYNPYGPIFNTNPLDPCAYVGHYSAECGQQPGLWPGGDPIGAAGSGIGIGGGGGGVTPWNPNAPPISLPPPSVPGPDPLCDWSCSVPPVFSPFTATGSDIPIPILRGEAYVGPGLWGRLGILAAGVAQNWERIRSATGTAAYRIPDILDKAGKVIGEVKNVGYLPYTAQLRDYIAFAQANGYQFVLKVREGATLSAPLQRALGGIGAKVEWIVPK